MVRAQASDVHDGVLLVRKSKSGKVRRVPLPGPIIAECSRHVGRLCPFEVSGNFTRAVRKLVEERLEKLTKEERKPLEGLRRFKTHLCRHTFASEWRESGGSLEALRKALGHSTVRVTEIYGEASDDLVLREARRMWGE
jgi:integrase